MAIICIPDCTLEIDQERGVVYVHGPMGASLVRISNLPTPVPNPIEHHDGTSRADILMLDIGVNWRRGEHRNRSGLNLIRKKP